MTLFTLWMSVCKKLEGHGANRGLPDCEIPNSDVEEPGPYAGNLFHPLPRAKSPPPPHDDAEASA